MPLFHVIDRQACTVAWRFPVEAADADEAMTKFADGDHGEAVSHEIGDAIDCISYDLEVEPATPAITGAPSPAPADSRMRDTLICVVAGLRKHLLGDEQNLDALADGIEEEFGLRDAVAQEMSGITIGASYRFDYPQHFQSLPDYTARAGQTVKVVRVLSEDEADAEVFPMFEVETADGWRGSAWPDELVDAAD